MPSSLQVYGNTLSLDFMIDHRTYQDATALRSIHPLETATKHIRPSRRCQYNPMDSFTMELDKMDSSSSSRVYIFFMSSIQ